MSEENMNNLQTLITSNVGGQVADIQAFCSQYLEVFNTGIHYSFIASVAAMLISLAIFLATKKGLPSPARKAKPKLSAIPLTNAAPWPRKSSSACMHSLPCSAS